MRLETYRQFRDTRYYVSDLGRIYYLQKCGKKNYVSGHRDKCCGADRIRISVQGTKISLSDMVWEVFMGKKPDGKIIVHRNGHNTMNELGNLKLIDKKTKVVFRVPTKNIKNLETGEIYKTIAEASEKLNTNRSTIRSICNGGPNRKKLRIAWWDNEYNRTFKGNYNKYMEKKRWRYQDD